MAIANRNISNNFGKRLNLLRKSRELTADELAKLSGGVSRSYILLIESGKRSEVSSKVTAKLANALRVNPSYLVSGNDLLSAECLPDSTLEAVQFILEPNSLPYLRLAEKARKSELSPTALEKIINIFIEVEGD